MHRLTTLTKYGISTTIALAATACGVSGQEPSGPEDDAPSGPVAVLPALLDLGDGDCGGFAAATFEVINPGDAPLTYALTAPDPRLAMSPSRGSVAPGGSVQVRVVADVPAELAAGEALASAILVETNAASSASRAIPVALRARGAAISIEPPSLGFGQTAVGFPRARSFTVKNLGNAPALVAIAAPGGELVRTFGHGGVVELAPGQAATGEAQYLPRDLGADAVTAAVTVTGAHCGARPQELALAGEGVAGDGVMVQGGPVEFGPVLCGGAAEVLPVQLVNPSAIAVPFSARMLEDPALDYLAFSVSPESGMIPPNGTVSVHVTRHPIAAPAAPRAFDAALRITTALGATQVTDLPVRQRLRTAQLQVSGPTDFGVISVGDAQYLPLSITNTGDAVASLHATSTAPFAAILPLPILPGETGVGWVSYTPAALSPEAGRVELSALGSCAAPVERQYQAGHGPFPVIEPVQVIEPCPAPAAMATELRIINRGTAPLEIACRERGASGLGLLLSPGQLRLEPHAQGAFRIDLGPGPLTAGAVTATIECTDNEPLTNTRLTTLTRILVEEQPGTCGYPAATR